jgi:hypothetical protein
LTGALRLAGDEQPLTDLLRRDVLADRQAGLEEALRPVRCRGELPIRADLDVPGALEDVHPMVGVLGVVPQTLLGLAWLSPQLRGTPAAKVLEFHIRQKLPCRKLLAR